MKINLYINYYVDTHHHRKQEISYCTVRNINNPQIDNAYVLIDDKHIQHFKDLLQRSIKEGILKSECVDKVTIISCNVRPTYNDYFVISKKYSQANDISVLANTDIFFDEISLIKLKDFHWRENYCMALCRYDIIDKDYNSKFFDRPDSQDVWVVKGSFPIMPEVDYGLGRAGCDNKVAYAFSQRMKVINPSLEILTFHLHLTEVRHYISKHGQVIDPLPPPYLQIQPTMLPV